MKINPISVNNYGRVCVKRNALKQNEGQTQSVQEVNFRGAKGAGAGALAGLGYLGLVSLISGPLFPVTLGAVTMFAGVGAFAGHKMQEACKESDKNNENKENKQNP